MLVIVSQRSSLYSHSTTAPDGIVRRALRLLAKKGMRGVSDGLPQTRLLAVQKWKSRTYLVFDIANDRYDASRGHLPEHNQLSVVVTHFSKKRAAYPASAWVAQQVNHDVAMLHNANGFDALPPFMEDHTLGAPPSYQNPRDISLLHVKYT